MSARRGQLLFAFGMGLIGFVLVCCYVSSRTPPPPPRQLSATPPRSQTKKRVDEVRARLAPEETVYQFPLGETVRLDPYIREGDRVDLYVTGDGKSRTRLVAHGVLVVAIRREARKNEYGEPKGESWADLIVSQGEVPEVIQAAHLGQVDFVLRSPAKPDDAKGAAEASDAPVAEGGD